MSTRLFVRVGPVRAVLDALLVNALALLLVSLLDQRPGVHEPAWLTYHFTLDVSLLSALRLRMPSGALQRQSIQEAIICQALLLPFCISWVFLETAQGQPYGSLFGSLSLTTPPWQVVLIMLIQIVLLFMGLRGGLRLWFILERLRRRHLRWRLTYALLLLIGLSQVPSVIADSLDALRGEPITASLDTIRLPLWILIYLIFYYLPVFIYGLIPALILGAGLLLPLSYVIMRSFTLGLETLVSQADALRAGNYDARIAVQGEDEVAQLQRHFNSMSNRLQRVLGALRAERDALRAEKELTQQLKTQIAELHIEIDQPRRTREVAEITGTDYFRDLKQKAEQLRTRGARPTPIE